jgi:ubiquinone/menaquinone biosynthesis C-methylase UbiE
MARQEVRSTGPSLRRLPVPDASLVMTNVTNHWIEWWNTENVVSTATWRHNMEVFVNASDSLLGYNTRDIILDVGSGPGYLAAVLKDRVREIHCLDTSQRYLDMCKEKFAEQRNVFIHKLKPGNYTDLSFLPDKTFSIIVCQSVVQYYQSVSEVERLIQEVRRVALPGAKFLIADIPVARGLIYQTYGLLKGAIEEKRLWEVCGMILRTVATTKHRNAYLSSGLLTFSEETLRGIVGKLRLDADLLSNRLTVNDNRRHLLIRF